MCFELKGYNCGTYTDFKDGNANGGVHSKASTIDYSTDSNMDTLLTNAEEQ